MLIQLRKFFSTLTHNIIATTVAGLITVPTLLSWATGTLDILIQTINTPTPLWVTIALALLCCGYIYENKRENHSQLNQSRPLPPSNIDSNMRLEEFREKVLMFISEHPRLETNQITSSFQEPEQRVLFNLQELEKDKLITSTYISGSDMMGTEPGAYTWNVLNPGLAYLDKYDLIK